MFFIRKVGSDKYLRSDIDSGGMDVLWVPMNHADTFVHRVDAENFVKRCVERFPDEEFNIEHHS